MDGLGGTQFRILIQDIRRHGVGEGLDDAGDDKEQAPQENEDVSQDHGSHFMPVVAEIQGVANHLVVSVKQKLAETVQITDHQGEQEEDFQQEGEGENS